MIKLSITIDLILSLLISVTECKSVYKNKNLVKIMIDIIYWQ